MGFFIKKSFNFGPVRFNLSKSGIGVSTGIKGLRVGVDSKGRSYVDGGKGMLRYKKYLGKNSKKIENKCDEKYVKTSDEAGGFNVFLLVVFVIAFILLAGKFLF